MIPATKFNIDNEFPGRVYTGDDLAQVSCQLMRRIVEKIQDRSITLHEGQQKHTILVSNYAAASGKDRERTGRFCETIGHDPSEANGWCEKSDLKLECGALWRWAEKHYPGTFMPCSCRSRAGYVEGEEFLRKTFQKPKSLIEGLIDEGTLTILGGPPASFKSFFALRVATMGATGGGELCAGYPVRPFKVLLIDEENREYRVHMRTWQILDGLRRGPDGINMSFLINPNFKLFIGKESGEDSPSLVRFKEILRDLRPDLVIIDSLVRVMIGNENEAENIRELFDVFKGLILEFGCAFLIIHHTRKGSRNGWEDLRGSSDLAAMADSVVMLSKVQGESQVLEISTVKDRDGKNFRNRRFSVSWDPENLGLIIEDLGEQGEQLSRVDEVSERIEEWAKNKGEFRKRELAAALQEPDSTLSAAINTLIKRGQLLRPGHGRYRLSRE